MVHITESKNLRVKYQRDNEPPCLPSDVRQAHASLNLGMSLFIYASINLILDYKCTHFKYACISLHNCFLGTKQRDDQQRHIFMGVVGRNHAN